MKPKGTFIGAWVLAVLLASSTVRATEWRITDTATKQETSLSQLLPDLEKNRILFIGEIHDRQEHHQFQLDVIRALHQSGKQIVIGMEMFRKDSQKALDQWLKGDVTPERFQSAYEDNWNFPWKLYKDILSYARAEKIPVVGLNVPKGITRQVARGGFGSLDPDQKKSLPLVSCHVDQKYMDFIERSYKFHGHGRLDLTYFCEAQLVWDKSMAVHVLDDLVAHPNAVMIVIAGRGHAQKIGIPAQIRKRASFPMMVLLPQPPGGRLYGPQEADEADYWFASP